MADERSVEAGAPEAPGDEALPSVEGGGSMDDALRYRWVLEHLGAAVLFELDAQGRLSRLGEAWEALSGERVEAWRGRPLVEAVHPEERAQVQALLEALLGGERQAALHEVRLGTGAGDCWVELSARRLPGPGAGVLGTLRDLSERRQAQEALGLRERYLGAVVEVQQRLLLGGAQQEVYGGVLAPLGRAAGASRAYLFEAWRDSLGRVRVSQKAEWCAPGVAPTLDDPGTSDFPFEEALGPEQTARVLGGEPFQALATQVPERLRAVLERQGVRSFLLLPLKVQGEFFGFLGLDRCEAPQPFQALEVGLLAGAAGALSLALEQRLVNALRARTEAALRRSEEGFHLLLESFPDPVLVHEGGVLRSANAAAAHYLGHGGPGELVGRAVLSLLRPEDQEGVQQHFTQAREGLVAPRVPEVVLLRRDGQPVVADLVTLGVVLEGRPALVTVARDFTERRELQARLMLADRMAAMGTLAAGIAHELNNPLSYVLANLEYVDEELGTHAAGVGAEPLAGWRQVLREARTGAERMRQLVRQLKDFSRVEEQQPERVGLHGVLDSVARMAAHAVRSRARLVKKYGAPPEVHGNEGKLFQVFLNLVINAAQAIEEGRREQNEIRLVTGEDGAGRAVVEVRDSGSGIPPEHLERLFEPFFTTKPAGEGTGLGLSICHTIVRSLGGDICVQSTPGQGSTFRVVLPRAP